MDDERLIQMALEYRPPAPRRERRRPLDVLEAMEARRAGRLWPDEDNLLLGAEDDE
jgi:hypothetical protein